MHEREKLLAIDTYGEYKFKTDYSCARKPIPRASKRPSQVKN